MIHKPRFFAWLFHDPRLSYIEQLTNGGLKMYVLFCYGVYGYYDTYNEALEVFKILEKKGYKKALSIEKMED